MKDISVDFGGLKLVNPIIAGSSGLTDSVEKVVELEKAGVGAIVLKSLFEEEILLEMKEQMHQMTGRFLVYPETFDYMDQEPEEDSVRKYLRLIKECKDAVKIPVIASVNCVSSQKWTYFAREIQEAGADALELNAFILPSDFNHTGAENEKIYYDIVEAVKKEVTIPIFIKTSYYFSNLASFLHNLSQTGISGLTLFNRFFSPDFDLENLSINSGFVLSSPGDLALSLRWIGIMSGRVNCDLAASTGVHNGSALIKQILAGANAVQVASTLYKNGLGQVRGMLKELEDWMDKNDFGSLSDFRGKLSYAKINDPAGYERVQFMKHFRHFIKAGI